MPADNKTTNHSSQPTARPPMSAHSTNSTAVEHHSLAHTAEEKYKEKLVDKAADKAAEETVDFVTSGDAQQKMEDAQDEAKRKLEEAKQEARGMWTKFCGCFGPAP
ncbi:hypothetical protein VKT23_009028 [Stygiomarasmius scandens]|uniref:Uncharacterized protein n=1 Tax=Marasmiellus scandens TaxID=2682957 RepID=A0ABR1JIT5_9AGAR